MSRTQHTPARRALAAVASLALAGAGLGALASGAQAEDQVLTWTADDSTTEYVDFPTEAEAGPATIVLENNESTGNTSGMQHTVTFDTTGEGYNHDVDVDIMAYPDDGNGGVAQVDTVLTEGTYHIICTIPGHGQMTTELVVTEGDGGGGDDDETPPEVSADISGETDDDGAYVGSATITLDATDDDSGVDAVEYQLDDGDWTEYEEPVEVTEIGEHTVGYRATDVAGNTSEPGEETFSVAEDEDGEDTTPPQVSATLEGETNNDGAYLGSAALTLEATDGNSGVDTVEYQLDDGDWTEYEEPVEVTETGEHTVGYRATDVAGNTSEPGEETFTVVQAPDDDTDPPEVDVVIEGSMNGDWQYIDAATVTLSATDDGSGLDTLEYALDGDDWSEYEEPLELEDTGTTELGYRATDAAGNVEEGEVTITIVADSAAPACPQPDTSPTVVIGTIGTDVRNRSVGDGCTIDDVILDEARWHDHDDFLAHVGSVLTELGEDGYVNADEEAKILDAAQRSGIGQ